ncbi:PLP-dependent cysteine synthase family protein [Thalassobius sp. Cn5-15]|uniref:PLP-dependent cysteine synthase family protein n=1 Tax=Thalassobius sp. Cn5-15 TaxID=2917763 RepID=UPI001EF252A0|nr:cysteine synthase family protein [Thalassobius sp. Cn5-15]MCG7492587.1 cysteine synthase family protein [Thalassobius sp. Cn5-15]
MTQTLDSILGAIGNTPLVRLDRLVKHYGCEGTILAKLDHLNPGFSKKDRAALGVIEAAERDGSLKPGQTVVELTSGNMGTGLAIICGIKGYPFVAVMSKGNSPERARMMAALGAEVVLVDQLPDSRPGEVSGADLAEVDRVAGELANERGAFRADQFRRTGNPGSHEQMTGPELWQQSGGSIDAFCDFVGSGGTLAGTSKYLRSQNPAIKCYPVEPAGAAVIAGQDVERAEHPIQGGGYVMGDLDFLRGMNWDGFLQVDGDTARQTARDLAQFEGIFAGFSAGANVAAAIELLKGPHKRQTIAVIICDSGLKYLSTDLFA